METTTVNLPAELKTQALQRADQLGVSLEEIIRQALELHLQSPQRSRDPFLDDDAVYDGDVPPDLSLNHDKYLYGDEE